MTRTGSLIRWRWPITASPDATTPSRAVCPTATARRAHWVVGTSSCTSVASRAGRSTWAGDPLTGSSAPARDGSHTLTFAHELASVPLGVRIRRSRLRQETRIHAADRPVYPGRRPDRACGRRLWRGHGAHVRAG